jgi:hypothetical protein
VPVRPHTVCVVVVTGEYVPPAKPQTPNALFVENNEANKKAQAIKVALGFTALLINTTSPLLARKKVFIPTPIFKNFSFLFSTSF